MKMIPPEFLTYLDPVFDAIPHALFNRVNDVFGIHQDPIFTLRDDIRKDLMFQGEVDK